MRAFIDRVAVAVDIGQRACYRVFIANGIRAVPRDTDAGADGHRLVAGCAIAIIVDRGRCSI